MEDTLRGNKILKDGRVHKVLILVLMEDTLRVLQACRVRVRLGVLILVLMEDTLRDLLRLRIRMPESLNPCFNGRYSQRWT